MKKKLKITTPKKTHKPSPHSSISVTKQTDSKHDKLFKSKVLYNCKDFKPFCYSKIVVLFEL